MKMKTKKRRDEDDGEDDHTDLTLQM